MAAILKIRKVMISQNHLADFDEIQNADTH